MKSDMVAAREALRCAAAAAAAIRASDGPAGFTVGWSAFLLEHARIFNMIHSCLDKGVAAEMAWKDDLLAQRARDPLLRWLKEARDKRNHDEGVRITAIHGPYGARIGIQPAGTSDPAAFIGFDLMNPGTIQLLPVSIGKGRTMDPPDSHLGKRLREDWGCRSLWDVADLAVEFTARTIADACARFPPPARGGVRGGASGGE